MESKCKDRDGVQCIRFVKSSLKSHPLWLALYIIYKIYIAGKTWDQIGSNIS